MVDSNANNRMEYRVIHCFGDITISYDETRKSDLTINFGDSTWSAAIRPGCTLEFDISGKSISMTGGVSRFEDVFKNKVGTSRCKC